MQVYIAADTLAALVDMLKGVYLREGGGRLMVHTYVKVEATSGKTVWTATNGEQKLETRVPCRVSVPGQVVVPFSPLAKMLGKTKLGEWEFTQEDDSDLEVRHLSKRGKSQGWRGGWQHPVLPLFEWDREIQADEGLDLSEVPRVICKPLDAALPLFRSMVDRVSFAVSKDDYSGPLAGVCWQGDDKSGLTLAATGGSFLAHSQMEGLFSPKAEGWIGFPDPVLVPPLFLDRLASWVGSWREVGQTDRLLWVRGETVGVSFRWSTRLIEGSWVNAKPLLEADKERVYHDVTVDLAPLKHGLAHLERGVDRISDWLCLLSVRKEAAKDAVLEVALLRAGTYQKQTWIKMPASFSGPESRTLEIPLNWAYVKQIVGRLEKCSKATVRILQLSHIRKDYPTTGVLKRRRKPLYRPLHRKDQEGLPDYWGIETGKH